MVGWMPPEKKKKKDEGKDGDKGGKGKGGKGGKGGGKGGKGKEEEADGKVEAAATEAAPPPPPAEAAPVAAPAAADVAPSSAPNVRVDHVGFGLVLGEDGKRFRTRSSEVVRLVDLLAEAVGRAKQGLVERGEGGGRWSG